jgi:transposase
MAEIFEYEIFKKDNHVFLTFSESDQKLQDIIDGQLGKTALFTDRSDMTDYQVISAYRSAWHVETSFKQMKNTDFLTVRPIFHWTDSRIAVHIFICVLAYRLCTILRKDLHEKGIDCNINQFLKSMGAINRVTTFYGDVAKPKKVEAFISGDDLSARIEKAYGLQQKYYS